MAKHDEEVVKALTQQLGALQQQLSMAEGLIAQRSTGLVSEFLDGVGFLLNASEAGDPNAKRVLNRLHEVLRQAATASSIIVP